MKPDIWEKSTCIGEIKALVRLGLIVWGLMILANLAVVLLHWKAGMDFWFMETIIQVAVPAAAGVFFARASLKSSASNDVRLENGGLVKLLALLLLSCLYAKCIQLAGSSFLTVYLENIDMYSGKLLNPLLLFFVILGKQNVIGIVIAYTVSLSGITLGHFRKTLREQKESEFERKTT